jgi:nucleotide-binding universal stress UspA family protein
MDPIRTILVAVDFSEHSAKAAETAADLAKQLDAELHVVHAFDIRVPMLTPYEVAIPEPYIELSRKAAIEKLAGVVKKIEKKGVKARSHLGEAPSAPAIVHTAEQIGADLIVMGTRGNTGLKHLVLGSVAERTLRTAPCSVLTVRG